MRNSQTSWNKTSSPARHSIYRWRDARQILPLAAQFRLRAPQRTGISRQGGDFLVSFE
ncbi:hypothetical protein [Thiobacillus denitrificans]|uniref:hypothetical protein n=1 Tax=Thiobacillus denitrificans TaxID=36861 RepID=UPI00146147D8|nr:hypothetical protein [Thiobacillus denitrificans]